MWPRTQQSAVTQLLQLAPRPGAGPDDQQRSVPTHPPGAALTCPAGRPRPSRRRPWGWLMRGRRGRGGGAALGPPPPSESPLPARAEPGASPPPPSAPARCASSPGGAPGAAGTEDSPALPSRHPDQRGSFLRTSLLPRVPPQPLSVQPRAPAGRKPRRSLSCHWVFRGLPVAVPTPLAMPGKAWQVASGTDPPQPSAFPFLLPAVLKGCCPLNHLGSF